jgi:lysyl-tRNA synthetase class 2
MDSIENTRFDTFVVDMRNTNREVNVTLCGRLIFVRKQGGIAFAKLQDMTGRMQIGFMKADWPDAESFKAFVNRLHIGTIVRLHGSCGLSSTQELTFWAQPNSEILMQPLTTFPDKFHGLVSEDAKIRKRYLDCVLNPEVKKVFDFRADAIRTIRHFMNEYCFQEVETPILAAHASGANARPFQTHLNAKDADVYLRIAPETYLKRYVAAGFDRVFEIGKNFRNEGMDPSHLPEFTSIEWYGAFLTHRDNYELFHELLNYLTQLAIENFPQHWNSETSVLDYQGTKIQMNNYREVTYRQLFEEHLGSWPEGLTWKERDLLFKKEIRPKLIDPTFIFDYPAEMAPLAARNKDNPALVDMWQLVINGWELVKCYQELVDPVLQEKLLQEQMSEKAKDVEAMELEPDFIECMKYGMPPMSGLGLGIDRLVCLLSNQTNLRDVVMFPILL